MLPLTPAIACDDLRNGDCRADLNGDGAVDVLDLLILLDAWGECPCWFQPVQTFEDALTEAGLTIQDWEDYLDVLENGSTSEKETWTCWFEHHMTGGCHPFCTHDPCPGTSDPFGIH